MNTLQSQYEKKFNSPFTKVKVNEFWDRYFKKGEDWFYKRLIYSTKPLYGKVLDVGSADGLGAFIMTTYNHQIKEVVGMDVSDMANNMARRNLKNIKNVKIIKAIVEAIPFEDNSFDCAHCGALMEHVFDDHAAAAEIHRVTKDLVVFTIPLGGGTSLEHVREYKRAKDFRKVILPYFVIIKGKVSIRDRTKKTLILTCRKKII